MTRARAGLASLLRIGCGGLALSACVIVPDHASLNLEAMSEAPVAAGTYLATAKVPWRYDFQCAPLVGQAREAAGGCPTLEQIVDCRKAFYQERDRFDPRPALCEQLPEDSNLVALTVSGGGIRSGLLGAAIMLDLQRLGVLPHVDVMSSVSGGSLITALYAATCTEPGCRPENQVRWQDREVFDRLVASHQSDFWGAVVDPRNLAKFSFTYFDRSDVLVETFANGLYASDAADRPLGLEFQDLNPARPNLILGATDVTQRKERNWGRESAASLPGRCFEFLAEHFFRSKTPVTSPGVAADESRAGQGSVTTIDSDLDRLPVAAAVVASNAFPGMFQYYSLRDYADHHRPDESAERYLHLADGGIRDQAAVVPVNSILLKLLLGGIDAGKGADQAELLARLQGAFEAKGIRYDVPRMLGQVQTDDICDVTRSALAPLIAMIPIVADAMVGRPEPVARLGSLPGRIVTIAIDSSTTPRGWDEEDPDPRDLLDRLVPIHKSLDAANTILDEQRVLHGREYFDTIEAVSALHPDGNRRPDPTSGAYGCCPTIVFSVHDYLKDVTGLAGRGLLKFPILAGVQPTEERADYDAMHAVDLGLDATDGDEVLVRRVARRLVLNMASQLCQGKELLDTGIPCDVAKLTAEGLGTAGLRP